MATTVKMMKENAVIDVADTQVDSFKSQGYDVIDKDGNVVEKATGGRVVTVEEHNNVVDELEALKEEKGKSKDSSKELDEANKKVKAAETKIAELQEEIKVLEDENDRLDKQVKQLKSQNSNSNKRS